MTRIPRKEVKKQMKCRRVSCECGRKITVQQALNVLRGDGRRRTYFVEHRDSGKQERMREENIDPTAVTAYDDEEALDRPWTMTDEIRAFLAQEAQSPEFLSPDDQIQIKGKVSDLAAFGQRVGG